MKYSVGLLVPLRPVLNGDWIKGSLRLRPVNYYSNRRDFQTGFPPLQILSPIAWGFSLVPPTKDNCFFAVPF